MGEKWHVLYYSKKDGSLPVMEYIENLSLRERAKVMALVELLEDKVPKSEIDIAKESRVHFLNRFTENDMRGR